LDLRLCVPNTRTTTQGSWSRFSSLLAFLRRLYLEGLVSFFSLANISSFSYLLRDILVADEPLPLPPDWALLVFPILFSLYHIFGLPFLSGLVFVLHAAAEPLRLNPQVRALDTSSNCRLVVFSWSTWKRGLFACPRAPFWRGFPPTFLRFIPRCLPPLVRGGSDFPPPHKSESPHPFLEITSVTCPSTFSPCFAPPPVLFFFQSYRVTFFFLLLFSRCTLFPPVSKTFFRISGSVMDHSWPLTSRP